MNRVAVRILCVLAVIGALFGILAIVENRKEEANAKALVNAMQEYDAAKKSGDQRKMKVEASKIESSIDEYDAAHEGAIEEAILGDPSESKK